MNAAGKCFEAHGEAVVGEAVPGIRLVHGIPVGRGLENKGRRYWHAWAEAEHPVHGLVVIDLTVGDGIMLAVEDYRREGQIEHAWSYTPDQARAMMLYHGHYGPWVAPGVVGRLYPGGVL